MFWYYDLPYSRSLCHKDTRSSFHVTHDNDPLPGTVEENLLPVLLVVFGYPYTPFSKVGLMVENTRKTIHL